MTIRYRDHALALGTVTRRMMSSIITDRGFPDARMVINWSDIVGSEYSGMYLPSKLKIVGYKGTKQLVLYLSPLSAAKCAFEFPYIKKILMDRISLYFGYKIIDDVRLIAAKR